MSRLSIGMYLSVCLLVEIVIWKEVDGKNDSDMLSCSCYSFVDEQMPRHLSQNHCKPGFLASIETLKEWEFIKTQIQNKTANEWWIGLERRDGKWTWRSNHSLTYDKWVGGKPDNDEEKPYATIIKGFRDTQGLFKNTKAFDSKGRICEYQNTNCSKEEILWCGSNESSTKPSPPSLTPNGTTGRDDTGTGPKHPYECSVIKKQTTPVVIPILVALAGLVVIVALNIIIIKCRNATQGSSKKRDKSERHSGQEVMDLSEETTIGGGAPSGIEDEENPKEDCTGNAPMVSDEGTDDIIHIDASCGKTAKPEQPYYVNVQGSTQQEPLPAADTSGHYAQVGDVNETGEQNDSFVVVRTYSLVCNDDNIDDQTDDMNTANYATVSDTLGTRGQATLVKTEAGYASVDVISGNSQKGPSGRHGHVVVTNAPHDGSAQYAVVDIQKKNSMKHKTKQADNQNNTDEGYAPTEVIYDNCRDIPLAREQQDNIQHTLADSGPYAGTRPEYAVVNKSMKKRNRSIRETTQPSKTAEEASYASVNVECYQDSAPVQEQRGSRRKNDNDSVSSGAPQVEYAAVDKSKKKNRSVKNASNPSKSTEASYASVNVECYQDGAPVQEQRGSRRKNDNESVSSGAPQVEYAAVDKSKKKNRSVKNASNPSKSTEASYASVNVECCQDGAPVPGRRRSRKKKDNRQQTPAETVPNAAVEVEYAVVDKAKKKNTSVNEIAQPSETTEASYASVDVIYENY